MHIYKLKIRQQKLHVISISADDTAVQMLASEFLVVMKIMTKHFGGGDNFLRHRVYEICVVDKLQSDSGRVAG